MAGSCRDAAGACKAPIAVAGGPLQAVAWCYICVHHRCPACTAGALTQALFQLVTDAVVGCGGGGLSGTAGMVAHAALHYLCTVHYVGCV